MSIQDGKSFEDLPNEIIEHIAKYLNNKDIIDCMCVSISWNALLRSYRQLSVELIEKTEAASFLATLKKQIIQKTKRRKLDTTQPIDNLGLYVRKFRLEDGLMTISGIQQLATMCPNVTTVRFDWYDGGKPTNTKSTRRFRSPVPFFEHFHPVTLTNLDLDGEFSPSTSVNYSWDTILQVLRWLPQLESLIITFDRFFPTLSYMEELHRICTKLAHLKIGWVNWRHDDTSIAQSKIKHVTPSVTMRSLAFPSAMSADWRMCSTPWYNYITHKYPSLTSLEIFPVAHYKVFPSNLPSRDEKSVELRNIWPKLEKINFDVFAGHPCTALPRLVKGIPDITLRGDVTVHFLDWTESDATNEIKRLSIATLPGSLDSLRRCTHLRELSLGNGNSYIGYKIYQELPLDIVLSCCLSLKKLSAFKCLIRYSGSHTFTRKSLPLETLALNKCVLADSIVLKSIGEKCLSVTHLDLYHCIWINTNEYPVIELPFMKNWFMYFRLVAPSICSSAIRTILEGPSRFRPSSASQSRQTRWAIDQDALGSNECLMIKQPEHNESNLPPLFWIGPWELHPEATLSRISNINITQWLSAQVDGSDSNQLWLKANRDMEAMRTHQPDHKLSKHWSTVLRCRGVDRLFYHAGRVNLNDRVFSSIDKRYEGVVMY